MIANVYSFVTNVHVFWSHVPCASSSNEAVSLYKSSVSTSAFVFDDFGTGSLTEGAFHLGAFSVLKIVRVQHLAPK